VGIPIHAIHLGVITVEEADHAETILEQRKFIVKCSSFREVPAK
jgi:hypothetical protein